MRLHGGRGQRAFELSLLFSVAAALPGDERPPSRRSGEASSASVASRATARAVTAS